MILDSIRHINPSNLNDIASLQKVVEQLINVVEELAKDNEQLKEQNRQLKDENAVLKGGNARPVLKGKKQKNRNISSGGKEKGNHKVSPVKGNKLRVVDIDREIKVEMNKQTLPSDAVFKGYVPYIQQDLRIERDNKKFLLATYYSASEKKTYKASFPEGEIASHFGAGVRSLLNILHHYGNVTTNTLGGLMKGLDIQISTGSISNLLKAEHDWVVAEQTEILQAGLSPQGPVQMDCTGNRQRGENKVTHIITAPLFSAFYTLNSKSRLSCLKALQGNPPDGLRLMWGKDTESTFREAKVSKADSKQVMQLLRKQDTSTQMNTRGFDTLLQKYAPAIYTKQRIVSVLKEVMALHYYNNQDKFKRLKLLMSDDAPEYNKIAEHHGLCWIHDARYYNKLSPKLDVNRQKLETFLDQYWTFYQSLLDYKTFPKKKQNKQKLKIIKDFDRLFQPTTKYGHLDLCIKRTAANKNQLLLMLDFPALPLHNNAAELGARKIVRKRDISLHTWTDWGTGLRDAFLSIIETARKLNIPIYDYINDRITGKYMLLSLAEVIVSKTR